MKKRQIVVVALLVVAALVFGAAGFLLVKGIARYKEKEKKLAQAQATLASYFRKDPFPSLENVQKESANRKVLEEWLRKLMGRLLAKQTEPAEKSPSIFVTLLGECRNSMVAVAGGVSNRVTLPPEFAFGFERYFGKDAPLPAPDDVPRLTQQLIVTTNVFAMLHESGVREVLGMSRETFESEKSGAGRGAVQRPGIARPPRGSASRAGPAGGLAPPGQNPDTGIVPSGSLHGRMRFFLDLKCSDAALMHLLNRLSSSDMFIAVTGVDVEKESDEVARARQKMDAVNASAKKGPMDLPTTRERILFGGADEEVPLHARIEFDVYRFRGM